MQARDLLFQHLSKNEIISARLYAVRDELGSSWSSRLQLNYHNKASAKNLSHSLGSSIVESSETQCTLDENATRSLLEDKFSDWNFPFTLPESDDILDYLLEVTAPVKQTLAEEVIDLQLKRPLLPVKDAEESVFDAKQDERVQVDRPVVIEDFIFRQGPEDRQGEFKWKGDTPVESEDLIERLYMHICLLALMLDNYHRITNFEEKSETVRRGCENHITRGLTHEFFFSTKRPLSEDEFSGLVDKLTVLAMTLSDNLQMFLATFPIVKKAATQVQDVAVIMQCGKNLQVDVVVKERPCKVDPEYPGYSRGIAEKSSHIFGSHTSGGTSYYNVVEICNEYTRRIGQKDYLDYLKHHFINKHTEIFPQQCAYTFISGGLPLNPNYRFGMSVVALDGGCLDEDFKELPREYTLHDSTPVTFPASFALPEKRKSYYSQLQLAYKENCVEIKNAPFGPAFEVYRYSPKQLKPVSEPVLKVINFHNHFAVRVGSVQSVMNSRLLQDVTEWLTDVVKNLKKEQVSFCGWLLFGDPSSNAQLSLVEEFKKEAGKLEKDDNEFSDKLLVLLQDLRIKAVDIDKESRLAKAFKGAVTMAALVRKKQKNYSLSLTT